MNDLREKLRETTDFLRSRGVTEPEVGIVLGTGLNDYVDRLEDAICIPYNEIPNFTSGKVDSHRGLLAYGTHQGKKIIVMAGRYHYYECRDMDVTAFPARVMVALGIRRLIITNAAGCVNRGFRAGQLMLISDHINLSGKNPLMGPNLDEFGPRFPDMTYTYDANLRDELRSRAAVEGIDLAEGVYCMFTGPSFETPAEIRMARTIGADAVGMSSVPEAIIANQAGCEIIGISFLSNMAAGVLDKPLTGEEVTEASKLIQNDFARVVDLAIQI
ncbi:MAG: purine-nucleoside phosphorylase [Mogibacterium sp.]|nr:purine-nucleoside phosphorylase [Mogibacterium sp.]